MLRVLILLLASSAAALAQVSKQDESLQEQLVPDSFSLTGTATSRNNVWRWQTSISYSIVNKSGINLYIGLLNTGISLGICGDVDATKGGLSLLPSPTAMSYSGDPHEAFLPASGRISGIIVLDNCPAPNPGFPTAPLSLTLMFGKTREWKRMVLLPLDAEIPIRQLAD